jgi:hypothetical protein
LNAGFGRSLCAVCNEYLIKCYSLILDTTWMYQDTKNKATLYSEAKHKLLENCFQEWVLSPSEINMFDLQGTPVKPNSN